MANPTGKNGKKGAELVQRVRGAVLNAFDCVEKGTPSRKPMVLSEILADAFLENPLKFLDTASKFTPKDINAEIINTIDVSKLNDSYRGS